jgi:S-DNA-T family DNA segregation ATPase FtsK/SpoIIIE
VSLPLAEQRDAEQPPGRALLVQEDSLAVVQIAQP